MKQGFSLLILLACLMTPGLVSAVDTPAIADATVAPVSLDVVTLKDGSVIYGEVVGMDGGILEIKSISAGAIIKLKWAEVSKLTVSRPIPFHLKEGTTLIGTAEAGEAGTLRLKADRCGERSQSRWTRSPRSTLSCSRR